MFLILSLAVQAALIVHVIKTGRNFLWIWAIALLPPAGPIAYIVGEILPEFFGGRTARRAARALPGRRAAARARRGGDLRQRRCAAPACRRAVRPRSVRRRDRSLRGRSEGRVRARSHVVARARARAVRQERIRRGAHLARATGAEKTGL